MINIIDENAIIFIHTGYLYFPGIYKLESWAESGERSAHSARRGNNGTKIWEE